MDASGNAYVVGYTQSSVGFPIANAFQPEYGGNSDAFVTKIASDTAPPMMQCPPDMVVYNDRCRSSAEVTYQVTATDEFSVVSITCNGETHVFEPPETSATLTEKRTFPKGTTRVTCTAVNVFGNSTSCSFTVTVLIDPCRFFNCR